jgi:N-acyl-D-aspartate/D-glutamate deacylase
MRQLILTTILSSLLICACKQQVVEADYLITNGTVIDGTGAAGYTADIAIKDDVIVFVGDRLTTTINAQQTIDVKGKIVSPGFIDPHTHADRELKNPETSHNLPFMMQGITTTVVGNDGDSFYPTAKYKELYTQQGIGTNVVQLIGHHEILKAVVGKSAVTPTAEQVVAMQKLMQKEMDAGAFGMSTGLYYAPGSYTTTAEVIALAKIVAKNDGVYDTHLRDESSNTIGLIGAVQEALEIGRQAKLPIHISHIKCLGVDVWYQSDSLIRLVEAAQKEGIQITANQYPYDASATSLNAAVSPRWAESGGKDSLLYRVDQPKFSTKIFNETKINITRRGGPDKLLIVKCDEAAFVGKTLFEISELLKLPPEEAVYPILKTGYVRIASFNMNVYDIHNFMKQDWVVTGSDGNTGHPRKYGTFPRKYDKYVKQDSVLNLATFIHQSTLRTANIFKIPNRGALKKGYYADVIIFNPETFKDHADYNDSFQFGTGLNYSFINGKICVENGEYNGMLAGRVLQK